MTASVRIILVFLAGLALVGCGRSDADLRQWIAQIKARPAEPIEPIPTMRSPEPMVYAAHELRDPFQRARPRPDVVAAGSGDGIRPDADRRREYLEGFPLDTLGMVGTIELEQQVYALIADREGVVHRVREGNYLGQNHGRIERVLGDRIELVELISDGSDGWMERQAQIALADQRPQRGRR